MRNRKLFFLMVVITVLLIGNSLLYAWSGEPPFGLISRETFLRRATEMLQFSWSPLNQITNYGYIYSPGVAYVGEAYYYGGSQNWAEFYGSVNSTSGGTTSYGNDCSAFVSISWKLPTRYATTNFESDATSDGGYVTKLGNTGSGSNIGLLLGDAFVRSGSHIILFESYSPNGNGINAIEQTPPTARRKVWTWTDLSSYRPIRRNNINEGNYVFKTKWGSGGNLNGQFNYPWGIEVDSSGNVYVADTGNDRVQKFNSDGGFITKWGSHGTNDGEFYSPRYVAVDSSGYVYVSDSLNDRVQKFNSNGSFITKWGSMGTGSGQFMCPLGIDVNQSAHVYVADLLNDRIQKFTSSGSFITKWGNDGTGDGQFSCAVGLATDSFGNVYVADSCNHRIQKFNSNGGFITKWGACCFCDTCPGIYFDEPDGIAVDASGAVYVADTYNHRIQKFDSNGTFITKWGSYSYWEDGKFQYPEGIAVDSFLNAYIADTYNDRIQKFSPVSPYPSRPISLTASAVSSSQINLSWTDNSNNETGFTIVRKKGLSGTYSAIASTLANITSFPDTSLSGPDTYYYAVYAVNNDMYSAHSNEASATIVQAAPAAPTNLTINAVTSDQIVISWTDNSANETGFKIERLVVSGSSSLLTATAGAYEQIAIVDLNVTQFSDTGLSAGTTYSYRVRAYNSTGDSAYSNEATGTTIALACAASARILGKSTTYSTLQVAYNAATNGAVIQSPAVTFTENLNINRAISITLDGGYNCDYTGKVGRTTLKGSVTITRGSATVGDFILQN